MQLDRTVTDRAAAVVAFAGMLVALVAAAIVAPQVVAAVALVAADSLAPVAEALVVERTARVPAASLVVVAFAGTDCTGAAALAFAEGQP